MLKCLLDSHTVLWTLYAPDNLPPRVRSLLEDEGNELFVSHISSWELVDKASKLRLPLAGSSVDALIRGIATMQATLLPIEMEDIVRSVKLPRHHNDPMDRVLIAQAQRMGAALLSKDGKFKLYDVDVLWK